MRRIIIILCFMIMSAVAATASDPIGMLREGDILFQASAPSEFSDAILSATARDTLNFTHTGIFALVDGRPSVIEAVPSKGVTVTPAEEFFGESTVILVKRLSNPDSPALAEGAAQEAMKLAGRPYDRRFAEGDSAVYCSELVQLAYRRAAGDKSTEDIFPSVAMNFRAPDGSMPDYWIEHFMQEGCPIPQGTPGTNPNSIAASPRLTEVFRITATPKTE